MSGRWEATLLPLLALECGCAMTIRPPRDVAEPTTVYIADYAQHASILLPREDGSFAEYAYGEWDWFALNHETVLDALRILLIPSRGTLGTRSLPACDNAESLRTRMGFEAVHSLRVDRPVAARLLKTLDEQFAAWRDTQIYNSQEQMTFVHSPRVYWMLWNCNTAVAAWVEQLGCEVSGCRLFADIQLDRR
ncbi:MAG: DUF2459 domain-containing protein [Planctomycetes bacterium]|nr:DUF2459 domain-containing protein [Planctomycetota bacterium]